MIALRKKYDPQDNPEALPRRMSCLQINIQIAYRLRWVINMAFNHKKILALKRMKIISLLWNEVIFYRTVGLKVSNQFIMSYQQRIGLLLFQGEIREAKWSEFDFKNALWTIPAARTKTNIVMLIHLCELTQHVLLELKNTFPAEFVICGSDGKSALSDRALPKAVLRFQDRLGIEQWTPHDLRRTFATQLGESLQIDPVVIEKCLGHKMPKIMATYNKNEMLPQRKEALELWGRRIESLISDKDDIDFPISNAGVVAGFVITQQDALNKVESL